MDSFCIEVSFIVPIYKIEYEKLNRCINSIIAQTGRIPVYEIILVDDGSPDQCGKICDSYATKYNDLVRVIHQKNQGVSVARNIGVKTARGKWITFVDGDDWIEPTFLEFATEFKDKSPIESDILIWDGYSETVNNSTPIKFFDDDSIKMKVFNDESKELIIDKIMPSKVRTADIKRCTDIGIPWGRIYRKTLLIENNIESVPELNIMEDSIFNLWAIEHARTICYKFKPLYHYSMYNTSTSKKYDPNISTIMKRLYSHFEEYIRKCHDEEIYWKRLYVRTIRLIAKCVTKDYANPFNTNPIVERRRKMKIDLEVPEFQTAIKECEIKGQELKFQFFLFLLRHRFYYTTIVISLLFGKINCIQ